MLGVRISCLTLDSAVEEVSGWVDRGEHRYVCVTGVHGVMECRRDPQLLRDPQPVGPDHTGRHADGVVGPVGRQARGRPRLRPGPDAGGPRPGGRTRLVVLLLRWRPGTAELLAERLTTRFPGLRVAGTLTPPFRPLTPQEDAEIVQVINDSGAQLVWVGLSTPKQERWMAEHVGRLRANALFGVGAAFDLHAGTVSQAPRWMQRSGLEWTYRLGREPRRLWRRYLRNNPAFVLKVLAHPPRLAQATPGSSVVTGTRPEVGERAR